MGALLIKYLLRSICEVRYIIPLYPAVQQNWYCCTWHVVSRVQLRQNIIFVFYSVELILRPSPWNQNRSRNKSYGHSLLANTCKPFCFQCCGTQVLYESKPYVYRTALDLCIFSLWVVSHLSSWNWVLSWYPPELCVLRYFPVLRVDSFAFSWSVARSWHYDMAQREINNCCTDASVCCCRLPTKACSLLPVFIFYVEKSKNRTFVFRFIGYVHDHTRGIRPGITGTGISVSSVRHSCPNRELL